MSLFIFLLRCGLYRFDRLNCEEFLLRPLSETETPDGVSKISCTTQRIPYKDFTVRFKDKKTEVRGQLQNRGIKLDTKFIPT